jgi:hypothetical protein
MPIPVPQYVFVAFTNKSYRIWKKNQTEKREKGSNPATDPKSSVFDSQVTKWPCNVTEP